MKGGSTLGAQRYASLPGPPAGGLGLSHFSAPPSHPHPTPNPPAQHHGGLLFPFVVALKSITNPEGANYGMSMGCGAFPRWPGAPCAQLSRLTRPPRLHRGALGGGGWATAHSSVLCPRGGFGPKSAQLPEQGLPPVPASGPVRPLGLVQPTLVPTDAWVSHPGTFSHKAAHFVRAQGGRRVSPVRASSFPETRSWPQGIQGPCRHQWGSQGHHTPRSNRAWGLRRNRHSCPLPGGAPETLRGCPKTPFGTRASGFPPTPASTQPSSPCQPLPSSPGAGAWGPLGRVSIA